MKFRHSNTRSGFTTQKRMCSIVLCSAFFVFASTSCTQDALWNTPIAAVRADMANGNYDIFDRVPAAEISHVVKLSPEAPFFIGQYLLDVEKNDTAELVLAAGAEKSPYPYNRLCSFLLMQHANPDKVITYGTRYVKKWENDTAAAALLSAAYAHTNPPLYTRIKKLADTAGIPDIVSADIPFSDMRQSLCDMSAYYIGALLLNPLSKVPVSTAVLYAARYFAEAPLSDAYADLATLCNSFFPSLLPGTENNYALFNNALRCAKIRLLVQEKYYHEAAEEFAAMNAPSYQYSEETLSAVGKALLYGGGNEAAEAIWVKFPDTYMTLFYRGRIAALRNQHKEAAAYFAQAAALEIMGNRKDHAVWYRLRESSYSDFTSIPDVAASYQNEISNPHYFADFFESYITDAVRKNEWNTIADLYYRCADMLDYDTAARLAYLTARGLETGKVTLLPSDQRRFNYSNDTDFIAGLITEAYTRVYLDYHSTFYYRLKAGEKLGQKADTAALFKYPPSPKKTRTVQPEEQTGTAESLLEPAECISRYLNYGLKNRAYGCIIQNAPYLTTDTLLEYANIFRAQFNDYQKSIRIAVLALSEPDRTVTTEDICSAYPFFYQQEITAMSQLYNVPVSVLCGLIRTESYFNRTIVSAAGAIGLTQLMPATAADIAKRLKKPSYDLTDPLTNISFGTFYLSHLVQRLDGNMQDALFSYNGGISRVRIWHAGNSFKDDDIFLETVPIEETRDYGRKVLAAAAVYRYLYNIN